MREPQATTVGGMSDLPTMVIQLLGPDNAAKIELFNQIQDLLISQRRWPKLLYLPKYHSFDYQDNYENLLGAGLVNLYLERQFDVITNLVNLPSVPASRIVTFETTSFEPKQLLKQLAKAPIKAKINLAKAVRSQQYQPLQAEPSHHQFLHLDQLSRDDLKNYQTFVKQQVRLFYQLKHEGLSSNTARMVLPLSWQQTSQQALEVVPQSLDKYLDKLPVPEVTQTGSQQLLSSSPLNELQLSGHIIHELSDVDYQTAEEMAQSISYHNKSKLLKQYLKSRGYRGQSLEMVNYLFEIVASFNSCLSLLERPYISCSLQTISPNLGYPIGTKLKALSQSSQSAIKDSFAQSLSLYHSFQQNYDSSTAENVCLLGHRVRIKLSLSPAQLYRGKDRLSQHLQGLISDCHPIIASQLG